jgi:PAS domain S-box-containing protein
MHSTWKKNNSFEILNALVNPILVIDRNYRIVAANEGASREFGLPLEKIVGNNCFRVTHNIDCPCWQNEIGCPVREAFAQKVKTRVVHQHCYSGQTVFEEIVAVPINGDDGEVNYVLEELNDITELVQSKEIIEHLKSMINTLQGIIPICISCKKVRTGKGYWQQVEKFVRARSEAEFTHGVCPECMRTLYPELGENK